MSNPIPYPTAPRAAIDVNPSLLVIYGQPKVGKSESVLRLAGCLNLVLRGGSCAHLAGNDMDIPRLCEKGKFGAMPEGDEAVRNAFFCDAYLRVLDDLYRQTAAGNPRAPVVAHDDLGVLEDWVFDLALRSFKSTAMGRSSLGTDLRRITDLPGQAGSPGWAYVWEEFDRMLWRIRRASPRCVLIAHMRDKYVDKTTGEVSDSDIDLSGKMRKILLREASATGMMTRNTEGDLLLTFKSTSGINVGAWCRHLVGKEITLGRLNAAGETIYDWSQVYLPEGAKP